MIIIDCEQRSPEWHELRLGIPTASEFSKIITPTGQPSKQAEKYLYTLAGERISGIAHDGFLSYAMQKGIDSEPKARLLYEMLNDLDIVQVGIVYHNEKKCYSCSPDGLINADGGLEIKHAEPHIQVERLLNGWKYSEHLPQVQGSLFITGRIWWDLMSYSEGLPSIVIRIERDDKYCAALKVELMEFCKKLDKVTNKLRELI